MDNVGTVFYFVINDIDAVNFINNTEVAVLDVFVFVVVVDVIVDDVFEW